MLAVISLISDLEMQVFHISSIDFTCTSKPSTSPKCEASFLQLAACNVCLNIIVQLMPD